VAIQSKSTIKNTNSVRFFFSSRRRHTRSKRDWSSDVCSSDLDEDDEERGNDDVEQLLEAVLQSPIDDEPDEADGDGMEQDGLERVGDEVLPHLLRIRARGELAGEREDEVAQSPTGDDRIVEGDAEADEADDAADPGESAPHEVAEGADGSQTRVRAQDRFGHEDGDRPEKIRDDQGD